MTISYFFSLALAVCLGVSLAILGWRRFLIRLVDSIEKQILSKLDKIQTNTGIAVSLLQQIENISRPALDWPQKKGLPPVDQDQHHDLLKQAGLLHEFGFNGRAYQFEPEKNRLAEWSGSGWVDVLDPDLRAALLRHLNDGYGPEGD